MNAVGHRFKTNAKKIVKRLAQSNVLGINGKFASVLQELKHDAMMPKYLYHSPIDYELETHTPIYEKSIQVLGEELPVPPPRCRPGYSPDDDRRYLAWGKSDHDELMKIIEKHYGIRKGMTVLDFGCSSGRVLRHFRAEQKAHGWKLIGTDIQSYLVEWMRQNFPNDIEIMCGSTLPHLPFKDSSIDVIYGISVFTHTKYLWDMWLAEFKRVLKPGGIVMQTVQCETAWRFYHQNRNVDWVKGGHPSSMLQKPEIDEPFFLYGDAFVSQTFFKEETIKKYWGRYLEVLEFLPPPKESYQNWLVCRSPLS
jgi:SAM-dependent methyltransferase